MAKGRSTPKPKKGKHRASTVPLSTFLSSPDSDWRPTSSSISNVSPTGSEDFVHGWSESHIPRPLPSPQLSPLPAQGAHFIIGFNPAVLKLRIYLTDHFDN